MSATSIKTTPRSHRSTAQTVSLKPKEHGAYAIVMIPLLAAIIGGGFGAGGVGVVALSVVVATLAGFFAHEPLLISLGHRGSRVQRDASAARGRAVGLLSLGVVAGTVAIWFASPHVRVSLVVCLLFACISFALAIARQHRTLGGQLLGVVGLSFPCVPILLAGGISWQYALLVWTTWLLGFVSTTLVVRGVIAAQKRQHRNLHWSGLALTTATTAGFISAGVWMAFAALPMIGASWLLMVRPPPAKHLRRVGWTLVAATVLTAVVLSLVAARRATM